jgi:hypothetical protein
MRKVAVLTVLVLVMGSRAAFAGSLLPSVNGFMGQFITLLLSLGLPMFTVGMVGFVHEKWSGAHHSFMGGTIPIMTYGALLSGSGILGAALGLTTGATLPL